MGSKWNHPKFKGKNFLGTYHNKRNGERNFVLTRLELDEKDQDYNSWQAAKRDGWKKK